MPETTPDTTAYLLLALSVSFGALALYVVSLVMRVRNLAQERATLDQLEAE